MQNSFGPPFFSGPSPANHSGPLRTIERYVAERLDVVHRGRAVVQPFDRGKRRLDPGLGALPLERFDERGFFAGFVGAGAAMDEDVAVEAAAVNVLPQMPGPIRLGQRALERLLHVQELAANVDVGDRRANRIAADGAPFDQQVRVALHQHVVLERAGLALVGVAGDVLRLGRVLEDELPLQARREAGAAAAAQARRLHLLDDVVRLQRQRLAQTLVPARVRQVEVEREGVRLADVVGEDRLEGHATSSPRASDIRSTRHTRARGGHPRIGSPAPAPGARATRRR